MVIKIKSAKNTGHYPILIWLVGLLAFPAAAAAAEKSDADKTRVVYQMFAEYSKAFPSVPVMSPRKAAALAESSNLVIVDVRQDEEMKVSMIPGAITRTAFLEHLEDYKNKAIVAYCTIGYRSGLFAEQMKANGVDVSNLKGGILGWALEGGKVYDANGISRRIHVYGKKWKYVPNGYEPVMFGFFDRILK